VTHGEETRGSLAIGEQAARKKFQQLHNNAISVDHQSEHESSNKRADRTISKSAAHHETKRMQASGAITKMQRAAQLRLEQAIASSDV